MTQAVAVYTDGGCVGANPSPVGITWAWLQVDAAGGHVAEAYGLLASPADRYLTNNLAELLAVIQAFEALPMGWTGTLYSDSDVTLGRLFRGNARAGVPAAWWKRAQAARDRLGFIAPVLLQGHPTRADLARGIGAKRNLPVSRHNVYVDSLCKQAAREYAPAAG